MKTGEIIKDLRVKKGLTQEELADKTELSVRTIQRIENGEVDPRSFTLQMIAKALDVDFSIFNGPEFDNSVETQKEDEKISFVSRAKTCASNRHAAIRRRGSAALRPFHRAGLF